MIYLDPKTGAPAARPTNAAPVTISNMALDALAAKAQPRSPFLGLPTPPPGVRPENDPTPAGMAMDEAGCGPGGAWGAWAQQGLWGEGLWFPGYPYLAELSQRPEYRNIIETIAEEMTRKWVKLLATGKADKGPKITQMEDAAKRVNLRDVFYKVLELDGTMGMGMVYIDLIGPGGRPVLDDPDELRSPLIMKPEKIAKGSLLGFNAIDPTWVSPKTYNSTDPLRPDYLVPTTWYVMGKEVHASRLIIVRLRELPDILKAAYNFGGLSISQMSKPAIDMWLRTRQSVSDLIHAFTVFELKTNWNAILADPDVMMRRIQAFVLARDNSGLMLTDRETEDLENISVPLGGLDALLAQAEEQMALPSQMPLLKLVGYTPKGLNASTDGDIRVWYDRVKAKQEKGLGGALTSAFNVIQLSEFGSIDPEITYEFSPLWELDAAGRAAVEKMKADTDAVYMTESVISNEEVRDRLAADPESPYHGLEGPAPEIPDPLADPDGDDDADKIGREGAEGSEKGANSGV